eukprot:UN05662
MIMLHVNHQDQKPIHVIMHHQNLMNLYMYIDIYRNNRFITYTKNNIDFCCFICHKMIPTIFWNQHLKII